jgi:hypothetical protein
LTETTRPIRHKDGTFYDGTAALNNFRDLMVGHSCELIAEQIEALESRLHTRLTEMENKIEAAKKARAAHSPRKISD